ncbi:YsnF/AvaK domain-containing protein [Massilia sp. GCM10023247]|uniref:YsnF/AvaK domain-containing protein n=1 Tax=Massilia sp. GCM10023247 TaxID=3252643 RepID=UPI003615A534
MQHTLIAVFDNHADAMSAKNELLSSGFSSSDVRLSHGDETAPGGSMASTSTTSSADTEPGIGASIKNFFSDIFGSDDNVHSTKYSTAVERGNHVLTVNTDSEPEVERAADIVERYGPIDIDEQSEKWGATTGMGSGAMMGSAGSMSGGQSMSLQSDGDRLPLNQQSLNDPNPMGTTYQEPMGSRDQLSAGGYGGGTGSGSSLQQNQSGASLTGSSLEGSAASTSGSSMTGSALTGSQQRDTTKTAIPVVQEQLKIGKREVQRGGVRVYSRVVETPVDESIGLREEHVNVERRTVDQPISGADATAFKEQSIEMRETAEEAVVEKSARIVEEVTINKEVSQREQQIHDTVRHTEVEVEQLGGNTARSNMMGDDDYYRQHFTSTYGSSGASYDEYAPAYSYGSEMRRNQKYSGRKWDEVENDLRTDWESRSTGSKAGSTWEKMKAAVRQGWDRMTDDDDDYYRNHYTSTYGSSGSSYDTYKPAYTYGSQMRQSDLYRNRPWDEAEPSLRSDWETRNAGKTGSTWENMKDAVRHGWNKMTK